MDSPISSCNVFAALHEDTDKGWVYLKLPPEFESRTTVKILRGQHSVYCEYRKLDPNFANIIYNERLRCGRIISGPEDSWSTVVVISDWYRRALGGFEPGEPSPPFVNLVVRKPPFRLWADLRASAQHPEPGVRVAAWIAIWGLWLGVTGLLLTVLEVETVKKWLEPCLGSPFLFVCVPVSVILFILCWFASKGVKGH